MKILCTFPGKHGDLLWALPSLRAISESLDGEPIDLRVGAPYGGICDLIRRQTYIRWATADPAWAVQDTAPMTPRTPPTADPYDENYDRIFHLGYTRWPHAPLPVETYHTLLSQWPTDWPTLAPLDLDRPWIQAASVPDDQLSVALGWTEEHFELKAGLTCLLILRWMDPTARDPAFRFINVSWSSRWQAEWWTPGGATFAEGMLTDWGRIAGVLSVSQVFLGDCSALHVLACALGKPVVLMEPNPHRHHPIFYPFGTGGRVRVVQGVDGLPTWDARHVQETLVDVLEELAE